MPSIPTLISALTAFFAIMLLFPALVSLAAGDMQIFSTFIFLALAYGIFAFLLMLAMANIVKQMNRHDAFIATIILWLLFVFLSIPPFVIIEGQTFSHALFEAISFATTLGITLQQIETSTMPMKLYRSLIAWQGGLLTLLFAVYVLGRYRVGGTPSGQLRLILHASKSGKPRILKTFFEIFVPYMALTVICAAILVIVNIDAVDAVLISLNILSTNGYLPLQNSSTILGNIAGEIVLIIFMIIGATSIIWHRTIFVRQWHPTKTQTEASIYLIFIFAFSVIAVIGGIIARHKDFSAKDVVNNVFDIVSIMTTTGITYDGNIGIFLPIGLILALGMVGGCSYSTAGGFKMFRLFAMLKHSTNEINRLVYPHIITAKSNIEDKDSKKISRAIWSALFISVMTIMAATILFSLNNYDLSSSLSLAVGAFSSTANIVEIGFLNSGGERPSDITLYLLSFFALIARIELLVLLAALSRLKW